MARRKKSEAAGVVRISAEELVTVPVAELVPYEHNARTHSDEQVERLRRSLREFGFVAPILIDEERRVIAGHGRLLAAQAEGMESVPCVRVGSLTEAQRRAYILADNRLAEDAGWDEEALRFELDEIAALDFDVSFTGFDVEPGKPIHVREHDRAAAGEGEEPPEAKAAGYKLKELFLCNPFSVLDCKTAEWQGRKRAWLDLGIRSEAGRDDNLTDACDSPDYIEGTCDKMAPGTSIFDPALCELMYRWFCPDGGSILDPFAGGSVRGIVAGRLGYRYFGNDIRPEQVTANEDNAREVPVLEPPRWSCGDSRDLGALADGQSYDMVFSCPPYYDLEIYSDDPADLSNMTWEDFRTAYREIIAQSCRLLSDNRFAVFVVGDVRDKRGFYRDLIGETKQAFADCGCLLYNEIIKLDPFGTAGARARRLFGNRKVVRVHQHVLVFYKGDPAQIKREFGEVQLPESKDDF